MNNRIIGNYKILSHIAEGGMGTVYYGEQTKLQRPVAIKVLHNNLTANPQFRDRFVNEAMILAQLNHPNIITIFDLLEKEGDFFIVTEYVQGDTIDNVMKNIRSPFNVHRALNIFSKTLNAFNYAHGKGIIHRDIKPSNIMLDQNDNPKILDFGIAKILQSDLNLTKAGTKMGSLFYMSPEQVTGTDVDHRSDIYSLGVVLYELLTNSLPYNLKSDTEYEIMEAVVHQLPVSISSFRKDVPENISAVVLKACQKDPASRFQSCEEFKQALSNTGFKFEEHSAFNPQITMILNQSANRTVYQSPQHYGSQGYTAPQKNNINKTLFLLLAIVIVLGGIFVFYIFQNSSDVIISETKKEVNSQQTTNKQNTTQQNTQTQNQVPPSQEKKRYNSSYPGDYPECSERYLTAYDVEGKSKYELSIMRNEVFARHGYIFRKNMDMKRHFESQSWYNPQYYDVTSMLSEIENYNVKLIQRYE